MYFRKMNKHETTNVTEEKRKLNDSKNSSSSETTINLQNEVTKVNLNFNLQNKMLSSLENFVEKSFSRFRIFQTRIWCGAVYWLGLQLGVSQKP